MRRVLFGVLLVGLTGCDLNAAFESYRDRFCAEACAMGKSCPERCLTDADGGVADAGPASTRGPHTLFKQPTVDSFVVVRLESSQGPSPASATVLEERRLSDGALLAAEFLNERSLALSQSFSLEGALARSEDGTSLTFAVAPLSPAAQLVRATMAHRVVSLRRGELEWGQVLRGFPQNELNSVVAAADGTYAAAGSSERGGTLLVVSPDGGATESVGQTWMALQIADGRLFAASFVTSTGRIESLGTPARVSSDGGTTVVSFTTNRIPTGFAFVDEQQSVAGVDALYVVERDELWKFTSDGGAWQVQWTLKQPDPRCAFVAARPRGPVLCSAGRSIFRVDEADGGASMRLLVQTTSDGGSNVFRGLAFPPN